MKSTLAFLCLSLYHCSTLSQVLTGIIFTVKCWLSSPTDLIELHDMQRKSHLVGICCLSLTEWAWLSSATLQKNWFNNLVFWPWDRRQSRRSAQFIPLHPVSAICGVETQSEFMTHFQIITFAHCKRLDHCTVFTTHLNTVSYIACPDFIIYSPITQPWWMHHICAVCPADNFSGFTGWESLFLEPWKARWVWASFP